MDAQGSAAGSTECEAPARSVGPGSEARVWVDRASEDRASEARARAILDSEEAAWEAEASEGAAEPAVPEEQAAADGDLTVVGLPRLLGVGGLAPLSSTVEH